MMKLDIPTVWLVVGFLGQGLFGLRMLVQWLTSERKRQSVIPVIYWYFSLFGSVMLLAYAIHRKDPVFILGQSLGVFVYLRNLHLIHLSKKDAAKA